MLPYIEVFVMQFAEKENSLCCQMLPNAAKCCQMLPNAAKCCQILPKLAPNYPFSGIFLEINTCGKPHTSHAG